MRVIEEKMLDAIRRRINWKCGNTKVECYSNVVNVYLHGNRIYSLNTETYERIYNTCGYDTATTRSRLNALGANVRIKNFEMVNAETLEPVTFWTV